MQTNANANANAITAASILATLEENHLTPLKVTEGDRTQEWQVVPFSLDGTVYVINTLEDGTFSLMVPWEEIDLNEVRLSRTAWLKRVVAGLLNVEDDGHDYGCE